MVSTIKLASQDPGISQSAASGVLYDPLPVMKYYDWIYSLNPSYRWIFVQSEVFWYKLEAGDGIYVVNYF